MPPIVHTAPGIDPADVQPGTPHDPKQGPIVQKAHTTEEEAAAAEPVVTQGQTVASLFDQLQAEAKRRDKAKYAEEDKSEKPEGTV